MQKHAKRWSYWDIPCIAIHSGNISIMQKNWQNIHESHSDLFGVIKLTAGGYSAAATAG